MTFSIGTLIILPLYLWESLTVRAAQFAVGPRHVALRPHIRPTAPAGGASVVPGMLRVRPGA